ncbi:MAG: nitrogen fixation protein NifX [Actinomycetota bacterium]|nr:nitrogen fixation protein NifX [Actinomycetota bacterium]
MLRVGFATGDGVHVDQHFGWCRRFDVYDVSAEGSLFVGTRLLESVDEEGESGRVDARVELVNDCGILHVSAIGGGAAARVVTARIHPVKVLETAEINSLLDRLQEVLGGTPPPWLRKLVASSASSAASSGWTPR